MIVQHENNSIVTLPCGCTFETKYRLTLSNSGKALFMCAHRSEQLDVFDDVQEEKSDEKDNK